MTLILMLFHKSIHRWNQLCKGFILSHFGWVACAVHHGFLGLHPCLSTIGISTTYCNEPKKYPPKGCMSATTIIVTLCSKSMDCWNPLCKGFILSHFGLACCLGQHCVLRHTIVYKALVNTVKGVPKAHLGGKRLNWFLVKSEISCADMFSFSLELNSNGMLECNLAFYQLIISCLAHSLSSMCCYPDAFHLCLRRCVARFRHRRYCSVFCSTHDCIRKRKIGLFEDKSQLL